MSQIPPVIVITIIGFVILSSLVLPVGAYSFYNATSSCDTLTFSGQWNGYITTNLCDGPYNSNLGTLWNDDPPAYLEWANDASRNVSNILISDGSNDAVIKDTSGKILCNHCDLSNGGAQTFKSVNFTNATTLGIRMNFSSWGGGRGIMFRYTDEVPAEPLAAAFTRLCDNSNVAPSFCEFTDTSTGPPTSWYYYVADRDNKHTYSSEEQNWNVTLDHPDTYDAWLSVSDGVGTDVSLVHTFIIYPVNVTPIPTYMPNITLNITPGPTVTMQTIVTFGPLGAYNSTAARQNLSDYFGNITGPFLDMADQIADGIEDLGGSLFAIPNYPLELLITVMDSANNITDQVLDLMAGTTNLILQIARIMLDSIPVPWQLLVVWSLLLDFFYLLIRGET